MFLKNLRSASLPGLLLALLAGFSLSIPASQAGDWSISLWGGAPIFVYPQPRPVYPVYPPPADYDYYEYEGIPPYEGDASPQGGYYPTYRPWNPVVNRDVYGNEGYAEDGTYHSEGVVEDRHSSYYSPGRNEAITRPRTSVENWNYGPNLNQSRERTTWIGADGRPHSTTVDRTTRIDPWGNSRTDTHMDLKRTPAGSSPGATQGIAPPQTMPYRGSYQPPSEQPIRLMPKPNTSNNTAPPSAPPVASPQQGMAAPVPMTHIETPSAPAAPSGPPSP
ncbi:MAG: hypothetical protein IT394_13410 [Candidatus Omnitrophica bacterium]|nr:hypothetical protein [Candidatus Omnitrophota bacterium]MCC6734220.1 hypothetical protein [Candidatus Omnitrophota bacterium]